MGYLATELRNRLKDAVVAARDIAEAGSRAALEALAVHHHEPYGHMESEERSLRKKLRAHARQLGGRRDPNSGIQAIDRLVSECAYEHWHRMLFARYLAENHLLIEPEIGVAISLEECEELAREEGLDTWTLAGRYAEKMLPQIFRPDDPLLPVKLARNHQLPLEDLLKKLAPETFTASDSLGWVYQFWQTKKKEEVNQSEVKIGADELPAVTQLFTEPYMVSFLIHNILGAWVFGRLKAEGRSLNGETEEEVRKAMALPGIDWEYLRFVRPPSPPGRGVGGEGRKKAPLPHDLLEHARELRTNQTDAEQLLWNIFRDRRFAGKKFRRQHPLGHYILDFYCHEEKLAVELDGGQHNESGQRSYDDTRSTALREHGIRLVRFWNNEVLEQTEAVLEALWLTINDLPSPPTPLPAGEGSWTPAAGIFEQWPDKAAELKILDPCCGSGHFLVALFNHLVPLRMAEEGLSAREACDAVLADNLHGLELDERCTQIAAFALALAAWQYPNAGGYRNLPQLPVACSGLAVGAAREEWRQLGLNKKNLGLALAWMHDFFSQASVLGSLLDPTASDGAKLIEWEELSQTLDEALGREQGEEAHEAGVAAQGLARSARMLAGRYHWVITNVPYLVRGKQGDDLKNFCERNYKEAKNDIATVFLERCLGLCKEGGVTGIVLPQNWLFLTTYKKFREKLLRRHTWRMIARLGPGAFETISGEVVKAILLVMSRGRGKLPLPLGEGRGEGIIRGLDASEPKRVLKKAELLLAGEIKEVEQDKQLDNPDARVVLENIDLTILLTQRAEALAGICSGDFSRFGRVFWENYAPSSDWVFQQTTTQESAFYKGLCNIFKWCNGRGEYADYVESLNGRLGGSWKRGTEVWGKQGIVISQMNNLPISLYGGHAFDNNVSVLYPKNAQELTPIWSFSSSPLFLTEIRKIDQKLNVTNATLLKVPFDLNHWTKIAKDKYPNGLPQPYSDAPTQWIFHGHPCGSVVWSEENKRLEHGPNRTDETVLQVAVARLLGYRWPAELDPDMELAAEQRQCVQKCDALLELADEDGIVPIPSLRGEEPAADRLQQMLSAAYTSAGAPSSFLDDWLRNQFFESHCKLFHHRPFIWHIWDGRKRDGFHALVNYHKLAEGNGKGRQLLEKLTYGYLGDWIILQKDGVKQGTGGAEDRLAAALELEKRLKAILEGEPPFDIFVRWKPLHQQPIGWEPDINDGIRLNIRPFLADDIPGGRTSAGILRWKPNIKWTKDRGKDVASSPWFSVFGGDRINDHHLTVEEKREARKKDEG